MLVCVSFLRFLLRSYGNSEVYGTDWFKVRDKAPLYMYKEKTGNSNLRYHLRTHHGDVYDAAIREHGWDYKLSTNLRGPSTQSLNSRNQRSQDIPSFSPEAFLEYLVRFIVADDQVSANDLVVFHILTYLQSIRVVECPEFRQLCMVLRETLVDADIPRRDKMREAIITQWRTSFGQLKLDLSVSIWYPLCPPLY